MKAPSKSPGDGAVIDTWWYDTPSVLEPEIGEDHDEAPRPAKVEVRKVKIELKLIKTFSGDRPPRAVREVEFVLVCKEIGLRLKGADVEALRAAMWEKLDEKFKIKWSNWFLVRVDHAHHYSGIGSGLTFSWDSVEKGIAWDGTELLRKYDMHRTTFVIEPWPAGFKDNRGNALACIPATDENQAALSEFSSQIDKLRARLADFVKPDNIEQTLSDINRAMRAAIAPPTARDVE